jgi:hypothetical protein
VYRGTKQAIDFFDKKAEGSRVANFDDVKRLTAKWA